MLHSFACHILSTVTGARRLDLPVMDFVNLTDAVAAAMV